MGQTGGGVDVTSSSVIRSDLVAVPARVAARIAHLSDRQVTYWEQKAVARPSVARPSAQAIRVVRMYDYAEMMALMVAAELRDRGVSLQHIRAVVSHLRDRGYARPLTDLQFATVGGELYFRHADGSWEGGVRPDQIVIHEVLSLEPLHWRIMRGLERSMDDHGSVERRRGALGSKPVVAGTRVPVETVGRYLDAGRSASQIVEAFPVLTLADVAALQRSRTA